MNRIEDIADRLLTVLSDHPAILSPDDLVHGISIGLGRLVGSIAQSEMRDLQRLTSRVVQIVTTAAREQQSQPAFPLA